MKNFSCLLLFTGLLLYTNTLNAQETKNLAEKLGYSKDAKLLIIHADDLGLSHSTNMAFIKAWENKGITSGSVMVPCPWFPEIADYVKKHPGIDVGIHLTLTSEWELYKWGGVLPAEKIPGLVDSKGFLYASNEEMGKTAKPEEVEKEMRAQIERAIAFGITPTHLDNHMGSLLVNPELIKVYIKLSQEFHLPILIPSMYTGMMPPEIKTLLGKGVIEVDNLFMLDPRMIKGEWADPYEQFIASMQPGLNEMIVHLSFNNEEIQAIANGHEDYGASWRQKDLDYVTSSEFARVLKENNITLIHWKQIKELMAAAQ